ncbi:MAG: hypothetical protein JO166_17410 [Deltaproteobacteria bacterium]|nr:hypothetical protein [Deltaproteobacteria bacterium]
MKRFLSVVSAFTLLIAGSAVSSVRAQAPCGLDFSAAVQAIGANVRAEITRVGDRGANMNRALRFQAAGDEALRRGDLAMAAQDYGRAHEAASALDSQRVQALNERSLANIDLERAARNGGDTSWAAQKVSIGNQALNNGDYLRAALDFAEARADLVGG